MAGARGDVARGDVTARVEQMEPIAMFTHRMAMPLI